MRPAQSLLLIALLTFFLGLGRQAITDSDEAFYAEAAREMVESGDWLTPHFNYEDRWQKPVLYYWLTAATYLVTGPTEFAARFWSAMSGLGLVLLTFVIARRHTSPDGAWLAGAITATSYGYFAEARLALPDLPLAFCITLGIWAALERRWVLAGLAAGLGFLMKGPLALVVPGLVLLPVWWREKTYRTLRVRDFAIAALVFTVVGLPWYVAMYMEHGPAYLESFFLADNFERFATDRFNEPRPFSFYIPIIVGGLMPWSGYLVTMRPRWPSADDWRLALWAGMPLLFFTLSIGKQPRYILPVLPPLAILLARSIVTRVGDAGSPAESRKTNLRLATWLTAGLYVLLAALLLRVRPIFIAAYPAATWMLLGALPACAAALAWVAATRQWPKLPGIMTGCAVVLLLGIQFGALSGRRPEPVEQMAAMIQANRSADEPIGSYRVFVRNLVFYTHAKQTELFDDQHAVDFLKSPERVLLVVSRDTLPRLQTLAGVKTTTLGAVDYLDTASIRLRTFLKPDPARDVSRVLLVTNR